MLGVDVVKVGEVVDDVGEDVLLVNVWFDCGEEELVGGVIGG